MINKADTFLRKSTLVLNQNDFKDDAQDIIEKQRPKYSDWKVETFVFIIVIVLVFTIIPIIGTAAMEGKSSIGINCIVAGLLAGIGYLWNLVKIRVDILNIECDYIDNLVNIIKSNQTAFDNIPE